MTAPLPDPTASASITDFINTTLSSAVSTSSLDLNTLDHAVSDLLAQLSVLAQDTSTQLERSIHDISRTVPRLNYDLQYMRESAGGVRRSLETVEMGTRRTASLEPTQTVRILDRLTQLDTVKKNMTDARSVLKQAESWSTLESETLTCLAEKRYRQAANRLAEASESIHMFQRTPREYDLRKGLLVSLQNQLEAALDGTLASMASVESDQPKSDQDTTGDEMDLPRMLEIFKLIEREGEYQSIYFTARRKNLIESWTHASHGEQETDIANGSSFATFLPTFLQSFASTLEKESQSIQSIFPEPVSALISFFQTTFEALEPSFSQRLNKVVEYHAKPNGRGELAILIDCWKTITQFAQSVEKILNRTLSQSIPATLATSPAHEIPPAGARARSSSRSRSGSISQSEQTKRSSRRFSRTFAAGSISLPAINIEQDLTTAEGIPSLESISGQWDAILYEPFLEYQNDYLGLETRWMCHLLKSEPIFVDSAQLAGRSPGERLLARGTRIVAIADEALERCLTFTLGFGLNDLLQAVAELFRDYLESSRGLLETSSRNGHSRKPSAGRDSLDDLDDLDDLADLDIDIPSNTSTGQNAIFKVALGLLRACFKLSQLVNDYTVRVDIALELTSRALDALAHGTSLPAASHFLDVTKGSPILLKQSGLHQIDLVRLVEGQSSMHGLKPAHNSILDYAKTVQTGAQAHILEPITEILRNYPDLSVWAQPDRIPRRGELQVPVFSLSPTDTISSVTEALLDLLRFFEGYTSDEAFGFALGGLPFVDKEILHKMDQAAKDDKSSAHHHHHRSMSITNGGGITSLVSPSLHLTPEPTPSNFPPDVVLSTWVSSTASVLLDHLIVNVLPSIRSPLTTMGAAQLAADLSYLGNATRAMDVESFRLECWRQVCEIKTLSELKEQMRLETFIGRREEGLEVVRYIARLRGWGNLE